MKQRHFSLRIDDKLLKEFSEIANYNGRSANKQLIQLIQSYINNFKKTHPDFKFTQNSDNDK